MGKGKKGSRTLLSLAMGAINGLFGAGGGIIAVVILERHLKLDAKKAHAGALLFMLPLTIISVIVYLLRGALDLNGIVPVSLGMLPGSFVGAKLLGRVDNKWLNRIFCALMLIAGVRMVFG